MSGVSSTVVVGYGSIGRYHARLLSARHERLAIIDTNPESLERARADVPTSLTCGSLPELDGRDWSWGTTLAVISTWGPSHAALFAEIAQRGVRHVVCEKPLAHSVAAAARMVDLARTKGITLGVHHHRRYSGLAASLVQHAGRLELGPPCGILVQGGARCLVTNGIHYVDFASELFNHAPVSASGTASGASINPRSPTLMFYGGTATWSFGEDRELTVFFTNLASLGERVFVLYRNALAELLPWEDFDVKITRRPAADVAKFPAVTRAGLATEVAYEGPVPGALRGDEPTLRLYDAVASGDERLFPTALAAQAVGACIGALEAGRNGRIVQLPIDPDSELGRTEWPIS